MVASYLDLIERKRDGGDLSSEEISRLITGISRGDVPDHQIGALLMAIYLRGLTPGETADLTFAMVRSGDTVDLSAIDGFKADKHSTGGVGDKVTLILGPLVAAAGVKFPKLSGRGLAHTGGTLDKLEAIPGMRVDLSLNEFVQQVQDIGLAVSGQTKELVPADGVLYSLRDQTATVDSIPLIASSVMSKKLAAGADGIVLDVKCGRGAFMKSYNSAHELAQQMVEIGKAAGKQTRALITSMDQPLGFAIGNALEVAEAIHTLAGHGPEDLEQEVIALAVEIVLMAGMVESHPEAVRLLSTKLHDGSAMEKMRQMVEHQGGDPSVLDHPDSLPQSADVIEVESRTEGSVVQIDALTVGTVAMDLGAGRRSKDDPVEPSAGVVLKVKAGDQIKAGGLLAELHVPPGWDERVPIASLTERLRGAYTIGDSAPGKNNSILGSVS